MNVGTRGGRFRARFTHHGLSRHIREAHLGWDMERVQREWPEWFAALRDVCEACTNLDRARRARSGMKSERGGGAVAPALAEIVGEEPEHARLAAREAELAETSGNGAHRRILRHAMNARAARAAVDAEIVTAPLARDVLARRGRTPGPRRAP